RAGSEGRLRTSAAAGGVCRAPPVDLDWFRLSRRPAILPTPSDSIPSPRSSPRSPLSARASLAPQISGRQEPPLFRGGFCLRSSHRIGAWGGAHLEEQSLERNRATASAKRKSLLQLMHGAAGP